MFLPGWNGWRADKVVTIASLTMNRVFAADVTKNARRSCVSWRATWQMSTLSA